MYALRFGFFDKRTYLYQAIVEAIVCSGLELKDFKGYRSDEYKSKDE